MKNGALLVAVGTNTTDVLAVVNDIHRSNSNTCEGLEVPGNIRVTSEQKDYTCHSVAIGRLCPNSHRI